MFHRRAAAARRRRRRWIGVGWEAARCQGGDGPSRVGYAKQKAKICRIRPVSLGVEMAVKVYNFIY